MRKIEGYQCDNCQTLYETEYLATTCEERHEKRKEGAKIAVMSFESQQGKYSTELALARNVPKSVLIKFSEERGDFGRYVLERYGYKGL